MRVDRFLYFARLTKSRSLAQSIVTEGHVRIDGKRVGKCSEEVRAGSVLALPMHGRVQVFRVLGLPQRRGPAAEAQAHYEELSEVSKP